MTGEVRREYVDARCVLLDALFGTPRSPGIAVTALGGIGDRDDVTATMVNYTRDVLAELGD